MTQRDRREAGQQLCVLGLIPVRGKLIWGTNDDRVPFEGKRLSRLQPGPKRLFRELVACSVEDARPDFSRRERHGWMWITWGGGAAKLSEQCGKSKRPEGQAVGHHPLWPLHVA